jgi:hypothetical protein
MLRPDIQTAVANGFAVSPIVQGATIDEDRKPWVPFGESELKSLVLLDRNAINKHLDDWTELWTRNIEAAR